jgi:hypothetical protein
MKCSFFCADIRGNQKDLTGLGAHLLYRVASKSYNEYGSVQIENLIYAYKYGFQGVGFYETHNYSAKFFRHIYRSLYKSEDRCRMYGQHYICALELSMNFAAPLSTAFIMTR